MKSKLKNPEIIKLIFKLFDGRVIEIQTSRPFLISVVDEVKVSEDEEVFAIKE